MQTEESHTDNLHTEESHLKPDNGRGVAVVEARQPADRGIRSYLQSEEARSKLDHHQTEESHTEISQKDLPDAQQSSVEVFKVHTKISTKLDNFSARGGCDCEPRLARFMVCAALRCQVGCFVFLLHRACVLGLFR